MKGFEDFNHVLGEFGRMNGKDLSLDVGGACMFDVDGEVVVMLRALESSNQVMAWSIVGDLPDDNLSGARAAFLLTINDLGVGTHGYTLSMDENERRLLAHDRRKAAVFATVDELAAWIDDLVETVTRIRREFNAHYPTLENDDIADDEPTLVTNAAED